MQPILLLHGAIGAADLLQPLQHALSAHYQVHTLNFAGHGGNPMPAEGLSIDLFARETLAYMDAHNLHNIPVFGYSMGGYVALYLAKTHPGRISKLITLATKFHWDPETAERECAMLNADKIEAKLPAFAQSLQQRHAPTGWKQLLEATASMLRGMGADNPLKTGDYPALSLPVLLLLGDRDKMVGLDETLSVYRALPQAAMGMLPATPHPLEQVDAQLLAFFVQRFLNA
jgi:pimeloyl-ACP methyl ester carboxylesterase